ncbi:hypothetical protein ELI_0743 [Eubacterium callanderi]|uniref:Uncharacterized protein n=1 Tax=Eubacterium callanderi TaxID=53442 RepID=E3GJC2_9FIRM|nr:hypothetical protein ELI_0743 [Eubacterium callanderi]
MNKNKYLFKNAYQRLKSMPVLKYYPQMLVVMRCYGLVYGNDFCCC